MVQGEATALVRMWLSQLPWTRLEADGPITSTCLHLQIRRGDGKFQEAKLTEGVWLVTHETVDGVYKWWVYEASHAIDVKQSPRPEEPVC